MNYAEALQILEDNDNARQQEDELLAELGSSAYMLYGNAADAMTVAQAELRASAEPELEAAWAHRVRQAEAFLAAIPVKVSFHWPPYQGRALNLDGTRRPDDIPF